MTYRKIDPKECQRRRKVIRECYADPNEQSPALKAARKLGLSPATVFGIARSMEADGETIERRKRRVKSRYTSLSGFRRDVAKAVYAPDATVESIRAAWSEAVENFHFANGDLR